MHTWKTATHLSECVDFWEIRPYQFFKHFFENVTQTRIVESPVTKGDLDHGSWFLFFLLSGQHFPPWCWWSPSWPRFSPSSDRQPTPTLWTASASICSTSWRWRWDGIETQPFSLGLLPFWVFIKSKLSTLQLRWREGCASSQDHRASVGARHLLLDQRPDWLQHLAEVELLLLTRLLVRLNQLDLFLLSIFSRQC